VARERAIQRARLSSPPLYEPATACGWSGNSLNRFARYCEPNRFALVGFDGATFQLFALVEL